MKRPFFLGILAIILICLLLLGLSDTSISIADTNVPGNEGANNINKADNSDSASATIVITMTSAPDE